MVAGSLAKKLQLKPGQRAALLNAPAGFPEALAPLPEGVALRPASDGDLDFVLLFVPNMADLQERLGAAARAVKYDALLWIAYPKGSAKTGTDLNRDRLWAAVGERGLAAVTLVSLDDVWSAMRFRPTERVGQEARRL
ncbi:MAG: hypothetical protein ACRDHE_05440 [Ktedonobacterales bacterium]